MAADDTLVASFERCLELGACPPCDEIGELVYHLQRKAAWPGHHRAGHPVAPSQSEKAKPPAARSALPETIGTPVYLVRLDQEALDEITLRPRQQGPAGSRQVLAGHLLLDDSVYRHPTANRRRLRDEPAVSPAKSRALWRKPAIRQSCTTATDHCCFCAEQKPPGVTISARSINDRRYQAPMAAVATRVFTGQAVDAASSSVTDTNTAKSSILFPRKARLGVRCDLPTWCWGPRTFGPWAKPACHQKVDFNIFGKCRKQSTRATGRHPTTPISRKAFSVGV